MINKERSYSIMSEEDNFTAKSKELYNKLKVAGVEIAFEPNSEIFKTQVILGDWCCCLGNPPKIMARGNTPHPPSFAHELLHIDLWHKDFVSDCELIKEFGKCFKSDFIVRFNNQLAHIRFYKDFIEMGFANEDFIEKDIFSPEILKNTLRGLTGLDYYECFFFYSIIALASRECSYRTDLEIRELEDVLSKSNLELYDQATEKLKSWKTHSLNSNPLIFKNLIEVMKKTKINVLFEESEDI